MCMYMYVSISISIYVHIYIGMYTYIHTWMYTCLHILYEYSFIFTYACIYVFIYRAICWIGGAARVALHLHMYTSNAYIYLYGAFRGIVRGSKSDVVTVADTRIYIYICIHVYIIYIWFRV